MNLAKSWTITTKDFAVFQRKKSVIYSLIAFPLGIAVGFPALLDVIVARNQLPWSDVIPFLNTFSFFFVIVAVFVSTSLASYSIVGEKVERSLEPLLATPTTVSEILLGKMLAAFLPTILATLVGATVFMTIVDALSAPHLGYLFYPNGTIAVLLVLTTPLACLLSVEVDVIISARAADIRAAQQLGGLLVLPFGAIYVLGEIQAISLDTPTLLAISTILAVADVLFFFVSRAAFQREEILTTWK